MRQGKNGYIGKPYIEVQHFRNGSVVYRNLLEGSLGEKARFESTFQNTIRASTVAYLGMGQFHSDQTDDVASFVPMYIRKSDAEINMQDRTTDL